jgi:hypothetical protein
MVNNHRCWIYDSKETHWYWSKLFRELTKEEIREYKIEQVLIGLH